MNPHYTYFLILAASFAGPLVLSFDKKVAFYKKWKYLFPAMALPAIFYIVWDMLFTAKGIWSFNEKYISGFYIGNLPLEEVLFFFVVPYCCVFIYECIICYFPKLIHHHSQSIILKTLALILIITALINYSRAYTFSAFLLCGVALLLATTVKKISQYLYEKAFCISYLIILIPFLAVNGFLTALPVVEYHPLQNLGIKLYTIPVEDVFYGMLLIFLNILLFEKFRSKTNTSNP